MRGENKSKCDSDEVSLGFVKGDLDANNVYRNNTSFEQKIGDSYLYMDSEFREYLEKFTKNMEENNKDKRILKKRFFFIVMSILLLVCVAPFCVLIVALCMKAEIESILLIAVSLSVDMIAAFMILPKIIAKYLFNKQEEQNAVAIITGMQQYNANKREHTK